MKRKKLVTVATAICSLLMSSTVFAGTWQTGTGENQGKWWYDNGNGSYTSNGWQWIDGNNDGTAECYYFDNNGWLLTNTTTPDGYSVNADGAWVENGTIQIQTAKTSEITDGNKIQLKNGFYQYHHADIYDETTGTLVSTGPVYNFDGSNYDDVINQLFLYGRPGDPRTSYYIENIDENNILVFDELGLDANYLLSNPDCYKDWTNFNLTRKDNKYYQSDYNSDTWYWIIENDETFKAFETYAKKDSETLEPTGEVYTHVITYKKIQ